MSQINRFYINKPNNFTELIIYKLYGYSLIKLFAKYESKLVITVINNSNYKSEKELTSIMKNIEGIENRKIILNYDDGLREDLVPNNQEYAFKDYNLDNFILRGTKPQDENEPPWEIAFVDLEAYVETKKTYRITSFKNDKQWQL